MGQTHLTYLQFSLLLLIGLSISSCQAEEKPEQPGPTTYASLFVRYIAPQGQLKVTAAFREGDSISTAQQGRPLDARPLPDQQVRYTLDTRAPFAKDHRFGFQAADGQPREAVLSLSPIETFSVVGGIASLSEGMTLYIKDEKIDEGESIVLLFSDANNKATTITLTNPSVRDTFPIAGIRLRKLQPGPHRVYLVKKQQQQLDLQGAKATAEIEYYTAEQSFEVTE